MSAYAMVVVIESEDRESAEQQAQLALECYAEFVGNPWRVTERSDYGYDTETCLRERPGGKS